MYFAHLIASIHGCQHVQLLSQLSGGSLTLQEPLVPYKQAMLLPISNLSLH